MISRLLNPYFINIFLLIAFAIIISNNRDLKNRNKLFVVFATLNWIVLSGLRHISIGADTLAYFNSYNRTLWTSWDDLFNNFVEIIIHGSEELGKDPGYYLFVKITQLVTHNYQIFLVIIALIFTVPLGLWIYRNSKNPFISFLIYSVLFYSFFSITGLRQTIATSIVVLIGYKYIKERRLLPFILLTFIGFTIHKSALVFFPFYFLANKKVTKKYLITILAIFPLAIFFRAPLALFFQDVSGYKYGIYEGAGTFNFTTLLLLLTIVGIWKSKTILANNPQALHFFNALIMSVLLTPLTWVNPSAMRVVQYYSIFLMLLVPEIINSFKKEERPIIYFIVIALLVILLLRSNPQYMFFWER